MKAKRKIVCSGFVGLRCAALGVVLAIGLVCLGYWRDNGRTAQDPLVETPHLKGDLDVSEEVATLRAQVENLRNNLGELHRLRNQSQQWQRLAEEMRALSNRLAQVEAAGGRVFLETSKEEAAYRVKESEGSIIILQSHLDEHSRKLAEEQEKIDQLRAALATDGGWVKDDPALREAEERLSGLKRIVEAIQLRILQEKVDQQMVVEKDR